VPEAGEHLDQLPVGPLHPLEPREVAIDDSGPCHSVLDGVEVGEVVGQEERGTPLSLFLLLEEDQSIGGENHVRLVHVLL